MIGTDRQRLPLLELLSEPKVLYNDGIMTHIEHLTNRMSFYVAPSMTAMKYQRQPYVGAPLQPGQRLSVAREMETSVRYVVFYTF